MDMSIHGMSIEHGAKLEDPHRILFVMELIQIEILMYLGVHLEEVIFHAQHFIMVIMSSQKWK